MPDRSSFMQNIIEHPADEGPRLVFADWLEEWGQDPDRANFIREQCALADKIGPLGERPPKAAWIQDDWGSEIYVCQGGNVDIALQGLGFHYNGNHITATYRRGCLEVLHGAACHILPYLDKIIRKAPIRLVRMFSRMEREPTVDWNERTRMYHALFVKPSVRLLWNPGDELDPSIQCFTAEGKTYDEAATKVMSYAYPGPDREHPIQFEYVHEPASVSMSITPDGVTYRNQNNRPIVAKASVTVRPRALFNVRLEPGETWFRQKPFRYNGFAQEFVDEVSWQFELPVEG